MHQKKSPVIRRIMATKNYKLVWIFGCSGVEISSHQVKDESILVVQNGHVILTFDNRIVSLKKNDCHLIPAYAMHSLKMSKDFEGLTIMGADARFEFPLREFIR
jgi:mannose-6-phosphate isomerase-like protein (cupin superfamily)